MMKDFIKAFCALVGTFAIVTMIVVGMSKREAHEDATTFNNGYCECGGVYVFNNTTTHKTAGTHDTMYYYVCDTCGRVISTHSAQQTVTRTPVRTTTDGVIVDIDGDVVCVDTCGNYYEFYGDGYYLQERVSVIWEGENLVDCYEKK